MEQVAEGRVGHREALDAEAVDLPFAIVWLGVFWTVASERPSVRRIQRPRRGRKSPLRQVAGAPADQQSAVTSCGNDMMKAAADSPANVYIRTRGTRISFAVSQKPALRFNQYSSRA